MANKKKNGHWAVRIVLMLIVTAALGVSLIFEKQINKALGFTKEETPPATDDKPAVTESIDLDVHFVDVGQGDACILELPDDRIMLIDSGESDSEDKLIQYIDTNIRRAGEKITYFDIVMITHSDSDHCGEMGDVLTRYPAKTFYRPNIAATNNGYVDPGIAAGDLYGEYESKNTARYKTAIEAGYAGAEVTYATNALDSEQNVIKPITIQEDEPGYYTLSLYTPTCDTYRTGKSDPDWNNYSPIMVLEYEGKRMALSGDAEKEAEAEFVALAQEREGRYSIFTDSFYVDLIKLGHHGSRTSTSAAYLDVMTTPASCPVTFAVASCGLDNSYGHPHAETLTRLKEYGFRDDHVLRTDTVGTIVASVKLNDAGTYALFIGEFSVAEVPTESGFAWRWLYIAGIIFVVLFVLIIILPSLTKRKRKKVVREAVDTVTGGKKSGNRKSGRK